MKYDVIVVGGGFAGTAAAVSAAREGAKVLLLEKSGFLGGAAGNCYVNPFMGYTTKIDGKTTLLSDGIFTEILDRLEKKGGLMPNRVTFSEEVLKLVFDEMTEESGVDVLFHAYLLRAERDCDRIKSVTIMGKGGEMTFEADYFIDATGDADLTACAGAPYRIGREDDNLCQPMTLCFRMSGVDVDLAFKNTEKINALYRKFREDGKIKNPREDVLKFKYVADGVLHLNSTRIVKRSPFDLYDLSFAEREARRQMFELYTFLKENCEGFENSTLLSSAPEIGVRESRMIDGEYLLARFSLERAEFVRKELRDLMAYLPNEKNYVIINVGDWVEDKETESAPSDKPYPQKAQEYLNGSTLPALAKLRNLDPLTDEEKKELESIFMSRLGSPAEFSAWSGGMELLPFLRQQLGIADEAIATKFGSFLNNQTLNPMQMSYCQQILDYARKNGDITMTVLLKESPFCDMDVTAIFGTSIVYIKQLINGLHKPVM